MSRHRTVILVGALLVAGCDGTPGASTPNAATPGSRQPSESSVPSVRLANWEQTRAVVAQHRGKVVVLDFWSSS